MQRTLIGDLKNHVGQPVTIKGWVSVRRDQGKLVFFDIRDRSGMVQTVVLPKSDAFEAAKDVRMEYVLSMEGLVNTRPQKNVNDKIPNGDIELEVHALTILNTSAPLPFPIDADTRVIDETVRLQYRYLDIRNARMIANIRARHSVQKLIRDSLSSQGFVEIETPLLSAPTPEGSRSFVVPSRRYTGSFYSLPQSPQQYKQLLMVGGVERYFQFAKCMRDEDTRGDRQPEFTQLDLEMSFTTEEEIMSLNEALLIELVTRLYPHKKIQEIPFPRMKYADAMATYGNDRPDMRNDKSDPDLLAFLWITDFPMFEKTGEDNVDQTGEWTFTHNPFSRPKEECMDDFLQKRDIGNILTTQYDVTLNGFEIGGGSIRNHESRALRTTFEIMGYDDDRITKNFGHMLQALEFGAPPHGGVAWGFDRLIMILQNEPNIREVIAFAKTGEGSDPMTSAPSDISEAQKEELHIRIL